MFFDAYRINFGHVCFSAHGSRRAMTLCGRCVICKEVHAVLCSGESIGLVVLVSAMTGLRKAGAADMAFSIRVMQSLSSSPRPFIIVAVHSRGTVVFTAHGGTWRTTIWLLVSVTGAELYVVLMQCCFAVHRNTHIHATHVFLVMMGSSTLCSRPSMRTGAEGALARQCSMHYC